QPIVARPPDTEPIMPRRILMSRAYQFVPDPEAAAKMQPSGTFGDNSQNTRCGLIGSPASCAMASSVFHPSLTFLSIFSRHERSLLRLMSGASALSVVALSPTRLTSIG